MHKYITSYTCSHVHINRSKNWCRTKYAQIKNCVRNQVVPSKSNSPVYFWSLFIHPAEHGEQHSGPRVPDEEDGREDVVVVAAATAEVVTAQSDVDVAGGRNKWVGRVIASRIQKAILQLNIKCSVLAILWLCWICRVDHDTFQPC
jgi:hypothetical protein